MARGRTRVAVDPAEVVADEAYQSKRFIPSEMSQLIAALTQQQRDAILDRIPRSQRRSGNDRSSE